MRNDLISIIIPCYNQANFLGDAIESALRQTHKNIEIIVVDDGSTDNTFEIASQYHDIKVIRQQNMGLAAARNTGLYNSNGQYLVFLDSDDRLLPDALTVNLSFLNNYPDCVLSAGHVKFISHDGLPLPTPEQECITKNHYLEMLSRNYIGGNPGRILFRKSIFNLIGDFNNSVGPAADYDLYLRITQKYSIHCHNKIIAEYRRHDANMSLNAASMLKATIKSLKSQKDNIKGNAAYKEAYKTGIKWWQRHYGEPLIMEIQRAISKGHWSHVFQVSKTLFIYYPQAIIRAFVPNLYFLIHKTADFTGQFFRNISRLLFSESTGSIMANPLVIPGDQYTGLGATTLSWVAKKTQTIEIRINAPDGPLFSRSGPKGNAKTDSWVSNGMIFYLQDVSEGLRLTKKNTLATVRVYISGGRSTR